MSSTGQDRSLGGGISIPQWMKTKTESYGFDPSTLSPPTHEDDFFYIRFPKPQQNDTSNANFIKSSETSESKSEAFSKHTLSCKQFLPKAQDSAQTPQPKIIKSMGVDDGFKGDAAACGQSVVAVAQQMLSAKPGSITRGFTTDDAPEKPSNAYLRRRRNSKSLPASPVATPETSPRARRKNNTGWGLQNRFFTGPFVATEKSLNESEENLEKKSGSSWLLSGLFSSHRENNQQNIVNEQNLVAAEGTVNQVNKNKKEQEKSVVDAPASEAVKVTVEVKTTAASAPLHEKALFRPKPSELREMNFWSPTSM